MSLILSGTDGLSDVDGSAATPAIRGTDANTGIFFPAADTIAFSEGGVEAMRIDSSGNLGIGTSSPTMKLDISGTSYGGLYIKSTSTNFSGVLLENTNSATKWQIGVEGGLYNTAGKLNIGIEAVGPKLIIDSSGNVGIGASSPVSKLQVVADQASYVNDVAQLTITGTNTNQRLLIGYNTSTDKAFIQATKVGTAYQDLVLQSGGGNLLVGTTAQGGAGVGITVIGYNNAYYGLRVNTTNSGGGSAIQFNNSAGTQQGLISTSGSGTTTYGGTSDYRLKENITPYTNALEVVSKLKPVKFKWIDGPEDNGFIAHELQAILPNAVQGKKDAMNDDGSINPQGIDPRHIVSTLTAAIQEQQALITTLTDRITALETP